MNVGRNSPCPCGSGKKYKKCCMGRGKGRRFISRKRRLWELEEVQAMFTGEIILGLKALGVDFDREEFLEDVRHFYSADQLSEEWFRVYPVTAYGPDEDFVWMAARVLWERLAPDAINCEKIQSMMQEGYSLIDGGTRAEGVSMWLDAFEAIKKRFTPEFKSVEEIDAICRGCQSLFNWCQDLEIELRNAGLEHPEFLEKGIRYTEEFCRLFPETDEDIIKGMRGSMAETYFQMGKIEEGERLFKALVEDHQDWEWGYIGWGDQYAGWPCNKVPADFKKAERIYRMGIDRVSDPSLVLDRIEGLKREGGR